jgi:hypothetical protein
VVSRLSAPAHDLKFISLGNVSISLSNPASIRSSQRGAGFGAVDLCKSRGSTACALCIKGGSLNGVIMKPLGCNVELKISSALSASAGLDS